MTDTEKQQCEEWCNQYNTLFIWDFFGTRRNEQLWKNNAYGKNGYRFYCI